MRSAGDDEPGVLTEPGTRDEAVQGVHGREVAGGGDQRQRHVQRRDRALRVDAAHARGRGERGDAVDRLIGRNDDRGGAAHRGADEHDAHVATLAREGDRGAHVVVDLAWILFALGCAVAAEIEREGTDAERLQFTRERIPRRLIGGEHVKQDHDPFRLGGEQPRVQAKTVAGADRLDRGALGWDRLRVILAAAGCEQGGAGEQQRARLPQAGQRPGRPRRGVQPRLRRPGGRSHASIAGRG